MTRIPLSDFTLLDAFPTRFLTSEYLDGKRVTLTIQGAEWKEVVHHRKKQRQIVLSFVQAEHELAILQSEIPDLPLSMTNKICVQEMFGRRTADWIGKRVVFYPEPITLKSAEGSWEVESIRVWGSPDLANDITINRRLGMGRLNTTLHAGEPASAD